LCLVFIRYHDIDFRIYVLYTTIRKIFGLFIVKMCAVLRIVCNVHMACSD
jgi:hypothetical protein